MCMVLVNMSDCLSMLFLVVTNFGHISISVLSTLSIKGRVILSDSEIIPIKLILTEALTATWCQEWDVSPSVEASSSLRF